MTLESDIPLPLYRKNPVYWSKLYGCSQAEAIARTLQRRPALVVATDMAEALRLETELKFFAGETTAVHLFPDWETLPYDLFSPPQDVSSARLAVLAALQRAPDGIFIIAADTLMQRLPPRQFTIDKIFSLKSGDKLNLSRFRQRLDAIGYNAVPQVTMPGDYAVRGSIIDCFPPGESHATRIDLFDDKIDSLRLFDPGTQISLKKTGSATILPTREFPLTQAGITKFRRSFRATIDSAPKDSQIYQDVSAGIIPGGIEYYLPLFFDHTATFFDYLADDAVVVLLHGVEDYVKKHWENVNERYKRVQSNIERPPLKPDELFLRPGQLRRQLAGYRRITISSHEDLRQHCYDGNTRLLPKFDLMNKYKSQSPLPGTNFEQFIENLHGRVLVVAESAGYREQLSDLLHRQKIYPKVVDDWQSFMAGTDPLCICIGELHEGVLLKNRRIAVVTGHQLLNRKLRQKPKISATRAESIFKSLSDIETDCLVVHEKYGIGRYKGLQTLDLGGYPSEFLVLEYADREKLYVPITALNLITRYTGGSPDTVRLHNLDGNQWSAKKRKAAQKAFDIAAQLLDSQARRKKSGGIAYKPVTGDYRIFADDFPYEETPDQARTTEEVFSDMHSSKSMDRIVCGDVGFGKTEIAMRAAFVAAQNNRQVAVLVPTTLLANQHTDNFRGRFADWPIQVEMLSRFLPKGEQTRVEQKIKDGTADVVIGTHKLLEKSIKFKRLGLIVIDEEQRFGVEHKEKLKNYCTRCDVLTLSSTPIPRTLSMSLSGLRSLSVIATPPPERLNVKTFISEWNDELIKEVCRRELKRGGQVYFLHNRVETIDETAERIEELLPGAKVRVAHGQMTERRLENVMLDFYHRRFSILVCTTIIESGLDVPTANSIIINEADRFGLSQLHQLRGRVGRSKHRAYAYLLPSCPLTRLSNNALRRLKAIESFQELGTGFIIASQDLEIRGGGELLGADQSGHARDVGLSMYNAMLKRAVAALKSGKVPDVDQPLSVLAEVSLGEPALIPSDYIPDVPIRLVMYRRIASAENDEEIDEISREMVDRFGTMPAYLKNLFINAKLRLRCLEIGISRIDTNSENIIVEFDDKPNVDVKRLFGMIRENPSAYRFEKRKRLILRQRTESVDDRLDAVQNLLSEILYPQAA